MATIAPLPPTRPRDAAGTRERILRAGQTLFAQKGYSTTGVREVAAAAGVNSTLVRRYFGSKEGLLRAALEDTLRTDLILVGDRAGFGRRAVAMLLQADTAPNPVAIMALAMADPAARALCAELLHNHVILPLAQWLGGRDAIDRAARLNLLWTGFLTARHLLPVRPLADGGGGGHPRLAGAHDTGDRGRKLTFERRHGDTCPRADRSASPPPPYAPHRPDTRRGQ